MYQPDIRIYTLHSRGAKEIQRGRRADYWKLNRGPRQTFHVLEKSLAARDQSNSYGMCVSLHSVGGVPVDKYILYTQHRVRVYGSQSMLLPAMLSKSQPTLADCWVSKLYTPYCNIFVEISSVVYDPFHVGLHQFTDPSSCVQSSQHTRPTFIRETLLPAFCPGYLSWKLQLLYILYSFRVSRCVH